MTNGNRFTLALRYIKKEKTTVILESISILFIFFIVPIVLGLMKNLQDNQKEVLQSVSSFPLIVTNVDECDSPLEFSSNIKALESVEDAYLFKDTSLYSTSSNGIMKLRERSAERSYYQRVDFLKYFGFFPEVSLEDNSTLISPHSFSLSNFKDAEDELFYIKKGEGQGAVIKERTFENSPTYLALAEIPGDLLFFSVLDEEKEGLSLGIYPDNVGESRVKKDIQSLYPNAKFSSYKEVVSDFYTALVIERIFLFLVLFLLLVILMLSFKKTLSHLIDERRKNIIIYVSLGAKKKDIYLIFLISLIVPVLLGMVLGIALSYISIQFGLSLSLIIKLFYGQGFASYDLKMFPSSIEVISFVLISLIFLALFLHNRIKRAVVLNLKEVSEDE